MTTSQVVMVPASINHAGTADVYVAVQNVVNNATPGSTLRFQPDGIYRMEKTLEVTKALDIDMNGATFKSTVKKPYGENPAPNTVAWRGNRNRANIRFVGDYSGWSVSNGLLRGCQTRAWDDPSAWISNLEAQHGIDVQGPQDGEIANMDIRNVLGDFIAISTGLGGARPTDIYCHDFYCDGNGRQGISVTVGSDIRFEHYTLLNMRRAVYDIELDTATQVVERVTWGGPAIDDVTIGNHLLNFFSSADARLGTVGAVTIRNHQGLPDLPSCVMQMMLTGGDASHKRGPYTILHNEFPNAFGTAQGGLITMEYVNGAEVHENRNPLDSGGTWPDGNVMYGVKHTNSVNIDVSDNIFNGGLEVFPIP